MLILLANYCISCYFREGFYFREFREPDPSRKFPLQFTSIYSNDNIRKIAKLTTRELPQKSKNAKITVRENNGLYSKAYSRHNPPPPHPQHTVCSIEKILFGNNEQTQNLYASFQSTCKFFFLIQFNFVFSVILCSV